MRRWNLVLIAIGAAAFASGAACGSEGGAGTGGDGGTAAQGGPGGDGSAQGGSSQGGSAQGGSSQGGSPQGGSSHGGAGGDGGDGGAGGEGGAGGGCVDDVVDALYVESSGDCGGKTPCYTTIQAGADQMGDNTLLVAQGTYVENVSISTAGLVQGGWTEDFCTRSYDASLTVVDGSKAGNTVSGAGSGTLEGMTFENASIYALSLFSASTMTVNNCIMENSSRGVGFSGGANTVQNSIIRGNTGRGFADGSGDHFVINCTIDGNGTGYGVGNGPFPTLINNIISNNTVGIEENGSGVSTLYNNDLWDNGTDYSGIDAGASDIAVDPQFEDAANGDYHLKTGSGCINAGTNTGAPTTDFDGDERPLDTTTDIGADEYDG